MCATMASCATTNMAEAPKKKGHGKEYFAESEYGVKASPRVVAEGQPVPKGGGRFMIGDPYEVKGKTYVPKEDPNYNKNGLASWYGSAFHGRYTANGEIYDSDALTAASPTFPLPSYARVTNLDNGNSIIVRVNDRGPYHPGRIIDVSGKTAEMLDMKRIGTARVNVQYVGRARMDGQDMPFLMASYIRKGDRIPSFGPGGQGGSGVMVASNQPLREQLQSYGSAMPTPAPYAYSNRNANTSSSRHTVAEQFAEQTAQVAPAPRAVPLPSERKGFNPGRPVQQERVVASTYSPAPMAPKALPPAARMQPVQQQRVVAQAREEVRQPVREVRQPVQRAQPMQTMETAYAAEPPQGRVTRVMFGNVLLEPPKPGKKY
ncbi:rare lipoprotein A [Neorhizobium sp. NCHU2750]|nr:rare lipoprotein A [Neorhizobium sp. NCHU2750]